MPNNLKRGKIWIKKDDRLIGWVFQSGNLWRGFSFNLAILSPGCQDFEAAAEFVDEMSMEEEC